MGQNELLEKWDLVEVRQHQEMQDTAEFLQREYGNKVIGINWTTALLAWKVGEGNPAGRGLILSASLNGCTVGSITLTMKRLSYRGEECVVAEIGDAFTSKKMLTKSSRHRYACSSKYDGSFKNTEYIERSIFARLAAEAIDWARKNGVRAIYGTPNALALPGWTKRLDFGLINVRVSGVRSRVLLTGKMLQKKVNLMPLSISQFCGDCIKFSSKLLLLFQFVKIRKFQIDQLKSQADFEFDELWRASCNERGTLIKDKDWLSWRYQLHPDIDYRIFTLKSKGELCGWLVLKMSESEEGKSIIICDWLYKTNSALWVAFIYKVLGSLEYQDAAVRMWSCDNTPFAKELWRLFVVGGAYVNIIFKPLTDGDVEFDTQFNFDEFSVGHTDNV